MACRKIILVVAISCLAACGGSNDNNAGTEEQNVAAILGTKADGEGFFLRTFPDPCVLLSEEKAQDLLGGQVVLLPVRGVSCTYQGGPEGARSTLAVSMQFYPLDMIDSKTKSRKELEEIIASLYWRGTDQQATMADLGASSFVFSDDEGTALVILTGIGGTAVIGDRIVSEAVLHYVLANPEQSHDVRLAQLKELATDQLSQLTELASTTHEGM